MARRFLRCGLAYSRARVAVAAAFLGRARFLRAHGRARDRDGRGRAAARAQPPSHRVPLVAADRVATAPWRRLPAARVPPLLGDADGAGLRLDRARGGAVDVAPPGAVPSR